MSARDRIDAWVAAGGRQVKAYTHPDLAPQCVVEMIEYIDLGDRRVNQLVALGRAQTLADAYQAAAAKLDDREAA